MGQAENIIGQKFGRLTIIGIYGYTNRGKPLMLCQCDCGNQSYHRIDGITSGKVKSCGCLLAESSYKRLKKYNSYDLSGPIGKGYTNKGEEFLFDVEDYDKIKDYCWSISNTGYLVADTNAIKLHRLVTNCPKDMVVDHINHNVLDNRKCNLRVCTRMQNNWNRKSKGVKLVNGKYVACMMFDGDMVYLGRFDTYEEARAARIDLEQSLRGEYAYANS